MREEISRMRAGIVSLLCFFGLLLCATGSSGAENGEIEYLLDCVKNSGCLFVRNDKPHSGVKAAEHLARKYRHAGKQVTTADAFIDRVASKSSMSGKPYSVICDDGEHFAREWLQQSLDSFRKSKKGAPQLTP